MDVSMTPFANTRAIVFAVVLVISPPTGTELHGIIATNPFADSDAPLPSLCQSYPKLVPQDNVHGLLLPEAAVGRE